MLTSRIIDGQKDFKINLAGMAIGNGLVSDFLNDETLARFNYYHGFVDETSWNYLEQTCCNGCIDTCILTKLEEDCEEIASSAAYPHTGLNPYNIYDSCNTNANVNSQRFIAYQNKIKPKHVIERYFKNTIQNNTKPCMHDAETTNYLNLPYVRRALHIPQNLPEWGECNYNITYYLYTKQYNDMTPFFKQIVEAEIPILLYYGDTDAVCNFLGGQKFAAQLGLPLKEGKKPWQINGKTGGFKTTYNGLTFITIRGAGHMAPEWRAPETAFVIKKFVSNRPI
jgi:cathepsin A (carboxypeptidase C)